MLVQASMQAWRGGRLPSTAYAHAAAVHERLEKTYGATLKTQKGCLGQNIPFEFLGGWMQDNMHNS